MNRRRAGVMASGKGSNFAALLAAARTPGFPVEIVALVSNEPEAGSLALAREAGVPALAIDHRPFGRDRDAHERAIHAGLLNLGAELVCLAGYMRLLTPFFVNAWHGRMLNIHPSLLPAFPGLHTHARAIAAGARLHGCTVHLVTDVMDDGPILGQAAVPVLPSDDADTLAARVLAQEHALYPATLRAYVQGEARTPDPTARLINPLPGPAPAP